MKNFIKVGVVVLLSTFLLCSCKGTKIEDNISSVPETTTTPVTVESTTVEMSMLNFKASDSVKEEKVTSNDSSSRRDYFSPRLLVSSTTTANSMTTTTTSAPRTTTTKKVTTHNFTKIKKSVTTKPIVTTQPRVTTQSSVTTQPSVTTTTEAPATTTRTAAPSNFISVINYTPTQQEWDMFCTVVSSETGYCSTTVQKHVAHTVINRVKHMLSNSNSPFPKTLYGILTQQGQYTCISNYFYGTYRSGMAPGSAGWNNTTSTRDTGYKKSCCDQVNNDKYCSCGSKLDKNMSTSDACCNAMKSSDNTKARWQADCCKYRTSYPSNAAYRSSTAGCCSGDGVNATKNPASQNDVKYCCDPNISTPTAACCNAYKANGLSEVSNVLSDHAHSAVDFAKTTYADTVKGTKTNWKNMTDAETRFQRNKQSYTDKAQQKAFEQGYDSMKSETSYETAYDNLKAFENQLKTAREAANKPNASKTAIDNYRKLSAKYDGMKTTLETRVNNGEFNALNKNGSVSKKAIAKLEKDVNTTKTKLDKVLADKNATPDEINTARAEYNRARSIKSAATKNSTFGDYSFRTISAIKDGRRMAGQNFITIAAAGNGLVA